MSSASTTARQHRLIDPGTRAAWWGEAKRVLPGQGWRDAPDSAVEHLLFMRYRLERQGRVRLGQRVILANVSKA